MIRKLLILLIITLAVPCVRAQTDSSYRYSLNVNLQSGVLLPEYGFINYLSNDYARGAEINFRKQSHGRNFWDQLFRYPSWGVSFFYSTLGNSNVFGKQFTLYPYYSLYLMEKKKFSISYQMGIGGSYSTKKFDMNENYQNLAIGSHLNFHYHADVIARYRFSDRVAMNAGIAFNHISNANLSEPNVGLNFATLYLGLNYSIGKKEARIVNEIPAFSTINYPEITFYAGVKHTRTFESFHYQAYSLSIEFKRRTRYKFAYGGGIDLFYDSSVEPQMKRLVYDYKSIYAYMSGLHIAEEFIYNKASLILQEGVYLGLTDHLNHYPIYNRAIVRMHFTDHFYGDFSMKSYLYILDFPQLGIGYKW